MTSNVDSPQVRSPVVDPEPIDVRGVVDSADPGDPAGDPADPADPEHSADAEHPADAEAPSQDDSASDDDAASQDDSASDDDAAEDAKWGLAEEAPLVGVGAPSVVAVLVTRDPGDWFEDCLRSLAGQDYENLSVLVIDNASRHDPTVRVAEVLPTAFVRRTEEDGGFSAAANQALVSVEGAPFLLFLHDDVRLRPDAVTAMVAEAFRANAGVVGAKLVDWDDETVLLSVGLAVDAFGSSAPLVDPGELDQSQHDSARNVFAVSSACMLVRSDLFGAISGFSDEIPFYGEDVDLCWRVHIAGASVQFCPRATVAHRGRFGERSDVGSPSRLETRHEARMVLANTELRRWWWTVPVGFVLGLVDLVGSLLLARFRHAGDVIAAGAWNVAHAGGLVRARGRVRRARRVHDADFRTLVHRGSYRLRALVRTDDGDGRLAAATRSGRGALAGMVTGTSRAAVGLVVASVVVAFVGARGLVAGPLPVMRELVGGGSSGPALVSEWWTAWRGVGLGEGSVPPGVVGAMGVAGTLLFGSIGLARRLLILLPLLVGAVGAWKMLSGSRSVRGRSAALAVYALSPIALNAIATGRLQALVVYGAAPWMLRRCARFADVAPFGVTGSGSGGWWRHLAGDALILGAVGAVSPAGSALLAATALVFAVGPWMAGQRAGARRMASAAIGGWLVSIPLQLPWIAESLTRGDPASLTGVWVTRATAPSAVQVITGSVGPIGTSWLGWGIVVAALVPMLTGRSWRFGWAAAAWIVVLSSFAGTTALSSAGMLGGAGAELFLVPAALGLAVAVSMGALAFEQDVVSGDFGVGQIASGVGVMALVVGLVPIALAASDGRWYMPEGDYQRALSLVDAGDTTRTLWIGDPDVLPVAGWMIGDSGDLAFGVTQGSDPTVTQRYRLDGGSGVGHLRRAVRSALAGRTARLGQLLAPMGIRYVLLIDRPAPEPFAAVAVPLPSGAVAALDEQLDLTRIPVAPGADMFEVAGVWPLRSDITDVELPKGAAPTALEQLALAPVQPKPVLGRGPGTSFSGRVNNGSVVAQSVTADGSWSLVAAGRTARRSPLFGWAQQFHVVQGGSATLSYSTPAGARLLQAVQVAALLVLAVAAAGRRRRPAQGRTRRIVGRVPPVLEDGPGEESAGEDRTDGAPRSGSHDTPEMTS